MPPTDELPAVVKVSKELRSPGLGRGMDMPDTDEEIEGSEF